MRKPWITTRECCQVGLFIALITVGAMIKIPVPVVAFTLQFLCTTLAGLLLGAHLGAIAVGGYIALGLMGLPVFASGGGIGYLLTPSFGYLIGFAVGAYLTGVIAHRATLTFKRALVANFAGLAVVYLFGMVYYYLICNLYLQTPIGVGTLVLYCFLLAVPGDALLCFVAAGLATRLSPVLRK